MQNILNKIVIKKININYNLIFIIFKNKIHYITKILFYLFIYLYKYIMTIYKWCEK